MHTTQKTKHGFWYVPKNSRLADCIADSMRLLDTTVVYVGNLSWSTTEEMLREFFGPSRILVSLNVQRHGDTNRSKGWGYDAGAK